MIPEIFLPFYKSTGLSTDTRQIDKNNLFVCIKGENFDGNTFAENALHNGASHVIVDNEKYYTDQDNMTLVEDSVKYLQELANFHRNQYSIPVIGITGSNGKTTSKELIHAVLAKKYNVLATKGNLNNHLGVPFTILRLTDAHEIAIIEMGANKFGDIKELCEIAEPDYGIITNIGMAHLEGFKSFEGVLKTKLELYNYIHKRNGTIFINAEDETLCKNIPANTDYRTYGIETGEVMGKLERLTPFVEMRWMYEDYLSPVIETHLVGKYNFMNFLAAIRIGLEFGVDYKDINDAIEYYKPTNNRSQVKKTPQNTLILDCYNANPTSMSSALSSFSEIEHGDKLFILGDMKELGQEAVSEHNKIIDQIESLGLKGFVVGDEFSKCSSDNILAKFSTNEEAKSYFEMHRPEHKLILLKGSRSIGLEALEDTL